jgi:hypothetical protein
MTNATADSCFIEVCPTNRSWLGLTPSPQADTGQLPAFKMLIAALRSALAAWPQDKHRNAA